MKWLTAVLSLVFLPSQVVGYPHQYYRLSIYGRTLLFDRAQPDGYTFLSETDGFARFAVRRAGKESASINVYYHGKLLYIVPDINVSLANGGSPPGEGLMYLFYLSPDQHRLLVVRSLFENVNVVYLYTLRSGHMRLTPKDRQIDQVIVSEYSHTRHIAIKDMEGGCRSFYFIRWLNAGSGIEYGMTACNFWWGHEITSPSARLQQWKGNFDLDSLHISKTHTVSSDPNYSP
jgi:hypothetical protein